MHKCFVLATLLWMERPTRGSLMTTYVAMMTISLLPPDLLYLLPFLLLRGFFTPHPFSFCYYSPSLKKHMVMQSTKTASFSMPLFLFIINKMVVMKMNIRILRLVIPFYWVSSMIMGMRACLSSFSSMHTTIGWWWCVPIMLCPWQFQKFRGSF